jgi:hypothetical protein
LIDVACTLPKLATGVGGARKRWKAGCQESLRI